MKTLLIALAAVLLAPAVQAQGPSKDTKAVQTANKKQNQETATQGAKKADSKATELDPNTRAQLEQNRFLLYNLGAKPGC